MCVCRFGAFYSVCRLGFPPNLPGPTKNALFPAHTRFERMISGKSFRSHSFALLCDFFRQSFLLFSFCNVNTVDLNSSPTRTHTPSNLDTHSHFYQCLSTRPALTLKHHTSLSGPAAGKKGVASLPASSLSIKLLLDLTLGTILPFIPPRLVNEETLSFTTTRPPHTHTFS